MLKEAVKQFRAGRVVLVDEFRTSRVSSADNTPSETLPDTPPESFSLLTHPQLTLQLHQLDLTGSTILKAKRPEPEAANMANLFNASSS
ncbi:hypothetical protein HaLaN_27710 [Haematococcus lacustris]|uniref:Uncharacterized protein n=1 Tax=Haematococcus lacustris TaxID=44745 RepID=A0A6A0A8Z9_HAELA|nr:hypothetical protein HaLaN_27710 [Haematococcus lacustris]